MDLCPKTSERKQPGLLRRLEFLETGTLEWVGLFSYMFQSLCVCLCVRPWESNPGPEYDKQALIH